MLLAQDVLAQNFLDMALKTYVKETFSGNESPTLRPDIVIEWIIW